MTIKRIVLTILTVLAVLLLGLNLLSSWNQPQIQGRLELYQTNLVLQAGELRGEDPNLDSARTALVGKETVKTALEQYNTVHQQAQASLARAESLLASAKTMEQQNARQQLVLKLQRSLAELELNLGVLQASHNQVDAAVNTWSGVIDQAQRQPSLATLQTTASILRGLWSQPPQLLPEAESQLKQSLQGWFRYRALAQLYQLQQRPAELQALEAAQQSAAQEAFNRLVLIGGIPTLSAVLGGGLLLLLLGQWAWRRKQALLSPSNLQPWSTPWDGEVIWQVLIIGFFLVGQIILPFVLLPLVVGGLRVAGLDAAALGERGQAFTILLNYMLLASGGLLVLYLSLKPFLPLADGWFRVSLRGNWFWWGLGGFLVAQPLVVLISALNQKIWQGQGGSNPILPIALEGKDNLALGIFFFTAAIAAPVFEELLFRGFLLPSLTRYVPVWGAIAISSLIFAVAHLNLSEVLPLTVLGMVLGFVYARSRNLLASMLLHSLWNTNTLISLIILGSSYSSPAGG